MRDKLLAKILSFEVVVEWGIVIRMLFFATTTNYLSYTCAHNSCLISLAHFLFGVLLQQFPPHLNSGHLTHTAFLAHSREITKEWVLRVFFVVFFFLFFLHEESQPLKQERFYLAILASRLLHLTCLLHWICQNVSVIDSEQQTKENARNF